MGKCLLDYFAVHIRHNRTGKFQNHVALIDILVRQPTKLNSGLDLGLHRFAAISKRVF